MPAASNTLDTIAREMTKNSGGAKGVLHWTNVDEVLTVTQSNHIVTAFSMRTTPSAGKFFKVEASYKDATFETTQDENGVWKTTGKFFIPKQLAPKAVPLNGLGEECNLLVVEDMNGQKRLIGDLDLPATVRVKEMVAAKNGYEVSYEWDSWHSPYFVTATLTT